ncbi:MAG: hypothetical protein ABW139_02765 [Candidatus Thiodiazotropha sp. DIVDIV]
MLNLKLQHNEMRFDWKKLNRQQLGAFGEYFVKMELTMYGFQVYGAEFIIVVLIL